MAGKSEKTKQEIARLIETFNEDPDPLHYDVTPSVLRLMELDLPGAAAVLDLLNSPELIVRRRAQRVLERIVARRFGWNSSQGYPDETSREKALALMKENGDYSADATVERRKEAVVLWGKWLQEQQERKQ
jgi:hypothetical protein